MVIPGNPLPTLPPPDQLSRSQSQTFTINDLDTDGGIPMSHTLGGTIGWIDPDALDRPTISLNLQVGLFPPDDPLVQSLTATLEKGFHHSFHSYGAYNIMQSPAAFGDIEWTFQIPDGAIDFLSQGQSIPLTATFGIGELVGSAQSQITINLVGTNLKPAIHGPSGIHYVVDLSQGGQRISNGFDFGDPNIFDTHQVSVFDSHGVKIEGPNAFFHAGVSEDHGSGTVGWFYDIDLCACARDPRGIRSRRCRQQRRDRRLRDQFRLRGAAAATTSTTACRCS